PGCKPGVFLVRGDFGRWYLYLSLACGIGATRYQALEGADRESFPSTKPLIVRADSRFSTFTKSIITIKNTTKTCQRLRESRWLCRTGNKGHDLLVVRCPYPLVLRTRDTPNEVASAR